MNYQSGIAPVSKLCLDARDPIGVGGVGAPHTARGSSHASAHESAMAYRAGRFYYRIYGKARSFAAKLDTVLSMSTDGEGGARRVVFTASISLGNMITLVTLVVLMAIAYEKVEGELQAQREDICELRGVVSGKKPIEASHECRDLILRIDQ